MSKLILTSVGTSLLDPDKRLLGNTPADGQGDLARLQNSLANSININLENYLETGKEDYLHLADSESKMLDGLSKILFPQYTDDSPDCITAEAASEIRAELQKINPGNPNRFSAEIASLFHIFKKELNDDQLSQPLSAEEAKIVLLASDSLDGCFCARVNCLFLQKYLCKSVETILVTGLQVKNPEVFLEIGLPELEEIIDRVGGNHEGEKILNVTGGYKGSIPFATIFAWNNGCSLSYYFEGSKQAIMIERPQRWQAIAYRTLEIMKSDMPAP